MNSNQACVRSWKHVSTGPSRQCELLAGCDAPDLVRRIEPSTEDIKARLLYTDALDGLRTDISKDDRELRLGPDRLHRSLDCQWKEDAPLRRLCDTMSWEYRGRQTQNKHHPMAHLVTLYATLPTV